MYQLRKFKNAIFVTSCYVALVLVLAIIVSILMKLIITGGGAINLKLITQMTPSPGAEGGLANAIAGSLIMTGIAILIATPLGLLTAIYLTEFNYGQKIIPRFPAPANVCFTTFS